MPRTTLRERTRYAFDALMAKGTWALIGWHLLVALAAVLAVSLLAVILGLTPIDERGQAIGFGELLWNTLMYAIAPSTITRDQGSQGWRALMMLSTVFGILLVGSLVGVLVSNVARRFDRLRQGDSRVLERDHTLVVGWSRQIFTIVAELALANRSRDGGCVVIYAERDKVWMEDELRTKVRDRGRTRVVVRAGDPTDPATLDVVSPEHARAIIVLAPEGARDDTRVMRALLAVGRTFPAEGREQHVVTEIRNPKNISVARLTSKRRTEVLQIGDLVAKIAVQTCLQAGLSIVYEELLSFSGHEIYFTDADELAGERFGDALQQFEDCVLIGLRGTDGEVELAPAMDRVITADEQLIVIAVDDDAIEVRPWSGRIDADALADLDKAHEVAAAPERTLILGWNSRVPAIVAGIDAYVAAGSEILVVSDDPAAGPALAQLGSTLTALALAHRSADTGDRETLDDLDPHSWDHVMVLPDDRIASPTEADAQVLVALLHLRDIATAKLGDRPFSVVSEMRDVRSRDLAEVARADDFIISDRLIGLLLAQIAEHADLGAVFAELLDPAGAETYLRPAADYVRSDREVDLRTVVEAGRRRGEVVLGVRLADQALDPSENFGVKINLRKSTKLRFDADDHVIVIAHD